MNIEIRKTPWISDSPATIFAYDLKHYGADNYTVAVLYWCDALAHTDGCEEIIPGGVIVWRTRDCVPPELQGRMAALDALHTRAFGMVEDAVAAVLAALD